MESRTSPARVEKMIGYFIKSLRTDHGGEFNSNDFAKFCEENGIQRQLTASYTPQQNGVSERKNRTILNMVRSMMARIALPKNFWPEATNWSVHLLNRSPTFAVKDMTPEEARSTHKPSVGYFKVFRCIGYAHIPDETRTKLDDKSMKCIFLGVSEESKAFRLYNPVTKKIIVSRDVQFDESKTWDWSSTNQPKSLTYFEEDTEASEQPRDVHLTEEKTPCPFQAQQPSPFVAQPPSSLPISSTATQPLSSSSQHTDAQPSQRLKRPTRKPTRLMDYVSGDELSDDEAFPHLALFADNDPISFYDAVKTDIWRKAMDVEIKSIEKNGIWELTDLPKGEKQLGSSGYTKQS
ncbi:unnamed protein product [Prunus armeniaca]